jgi:hypothetical protein
MFYRFANTYFGTKKAELPQGWVPSDEVVESFRASLKALKVPFTDEEFNAQKDWVKDRIRWEMYYRAFDKTVAERFKWGGDPEVLKAIESLPKAQTLLNQAAKVYAMRK